MNGVAAGVASKASHPRQCSGWKVAHVTENDVKKVVWSGWQQLTPSIVALCVSLRVFA